MAITSRKFPGSLKYGMLAAALNSAERVIGVLIDLEVKAAGSVASFNKRTPAPEGELLVLRRQESPPLGAALVVFGEAIVDGQRQDVGVFRKNDLAMFPDDWSSRVEFGERTADVAITGPARF